MSDGDDENIEVIFVQPNGTEKPIKVRPGFSLMEAAQNEGVSGIIGECGGQCSCATCHVYVDEDFIDRLPEMDELQDEMLEGVASPRESNSRLSCQITVTPDLAGLRIRVPKTQY